MKLQQAYRGGYQGRPGWWIHLTFEEVGVAMLKLAVPPPFRTWDEEQKRWWVADEAVEAALTVVPSLEAHLRQVPLL